MKDTLLVLLRGGAIIPVQSDPAGALQRVNELLETPAEFICIELQRGPLRLRTADIQGVQWVDGDTYWRNGQGAALIGDYN